MNFIPYYRALKVSTTLGRSNDDSPADSGCFDLGSKSTNPGGCPLDLDAAITEEEAKKLVTIGWDLFSSSNPCVKSVEVAYETVKKVVNACKVDNHFNRIKFDNSSSVSWYYVGRLTGKKCYSGKLHESEPVIPCGKTTELTATGSGGIMFRDEKSTRHLYIAYSRPTCGRNKIDVQIYGAEPDWDCLHHMWEEMTRHYNEWTETFENHSLAWYFRNTGGDTNSVDIYMKDDVNQAFNYTQEFGGNGGREFKDMLEFNPAVWGQITSVFIKHGSRIDGIGVLYAGGQNFEYGGGGGSQSEIRLEEAEYITKVAGRSGARLDQLRFETNKGRSFQFGGDGGKYFEVNLGGDSLVGLVGRSGKEVDKIGFLFAKPVPPLAVSVFRSPAYGGRGGHAFDDRASRGAPLGKITKICVRHGSRIDKVGFKYKNHGWIMHGGNGGSSHTFTLKPNEYIIEVSGRKGSRVDQLTFHLNTGRASPTYGGGGGSYFKYSMDNKVVTGLFGRSGSEIDKIGFYFSDAPEGIEYTKPPPSCPIQ